MDRTAKLKNKQAELMARLAEYKASKGEKVKPGCSVSSKVMISTTKPAPSAKSTRRPMTKLQNNVQKPKTNTVVSQENLVDHVEEKPSTALRRRSFTIAEGKVNSPLNHPVVGANPTEEKNVQDICPDTQNAENVEPTIDEENTPDSQLKEARKSCSPMKPIKQENLESKCDCEALVEAGTKPIQPKPQSAVKPIIRKSPRTSMIERLEQWKQQKQAKITPSIRRNSPKFNTLFTKRVPLLTPQAGTNSAAVNNPISRKKPETNKFIAPDNATSTYDRRKPKSNTCNILEKKTSSIRRRSLPKSNSVRRQSLSKTNSVRRQSLTKSGRPSVSNVKPSVGAQAHKGPLTALERRKSYAANLSAKRPEVTAEPRRKSYVPSRLFQQLKSPPLNEVKKQVISVHSKSVKTITSGTLLKNEPRKGSLLAAQSPKVSDLNKRKSFQHATSDKKFNGDLRRKSCLPAVNTQNKESTKVAPRRSSVMPGTHKSNDKLTALERRKSYADSLKNRVVSTSHMKTKSAVGKRSLVVEDGHEESKAKRQRLNNSMDNSTIIKSNLAVVKPTILTPTQSLTPVNKLPPKTPKSARLSVRFKTPESHMLSPIMGSLPDPETPDDINMGSHSLEEDHKSQMTTPKSTLSRLSPIKKEMSIREKLDAWLSAHGKTPSRYRNMLKFGDDLTNSIEGKVMGGLTVDQLSLQLDYINLEQNLLETEIPELSPKVLDPVTERVEQLLTECLTLLEAECPAGTIEQWLQEICKHHSGAKNRAKYWICQAKLAERTGDKSAVVGMYEEAVRHNAQPPEEVAEALKEFVENMNHVRSPESILLSSPQHIVSESCGRKRKEVQEENIFTSSAIKYCYTETTPFFTRLRSKTRRSYKSPKGVITPVRRSTRRSVTTLPSMFQDHDTVVDSVNCLHSSQKESALFVPNRALQDELDAAAVSPL